MSTALNFKINNDFRLQVQRCKDLWIDIEFSNHKTYTFSVIYRHPHNNHLAFFEALDERMFMLNKKKKKCLVLGDINIDLNQGWQYDTLVRYGTPQFLLRSLIRWYGTLFLKWYKHGTLVWYAFFVKVRARYVGTLFELQTQTFRTLRWLFVCKAKNLLISKSVKVTSS